MLTIYSSPLQGLTDFRFRNAFQRFFGGIDKYIAPYIRVNGKTEIKPANERDILPANNSSLDLIPQIITKDADEFLFVAKYVQNLGYTELNWNLGCPYPIVAKRGMGSGLLSMPEKIDEILTRVCADPFLPAMIKADNPVSPENRYEVFNSFHDALFSSYEEALSGQKHLLMKMYSFWEYFIQSFPNSPKYLKKIKKARSIGVCRDVVKQIIYNEALE